MPGGASGTFIFTAAAQSAIASDAEGRLSLPKLEISPQMIVRQSPLPIYALFFSGKPAGCNSGHADCG
jgi:hypothetical protein